MWPWMRLALLLLGGCPSGPVNTRVHVSNVLVHLLGRCSPYSSHAGLQIRTSSVDTTTLGIGWIKTNLDELQAIRNVHVWLETVMDSVQRQAGDDGAGAHVVVGSNVCSIAPAPIWGNCSQSRHCSRQC